MYMQPIPIDEYLMYFTFHQTPFQHLPDTSLQIINDMVTQRDLLLQNAT